MDVLEVVEVVDIYNRIFSFFEGKGREILIKKKFFMGSEEEILKIFLEIN